MGDIEFNIIRLLEHSPGLSDKELTEGIRGPGASPQYVNEKCRNLQSNHIITRKKRQDGLIGNWLNENDETSQFIDRTGIQKKNESISEKQIKKTLESYLISRGWELAISWRLTPGVDIEARNGRNRWIIEVKGIDPTNAWPVNPFVAVLGEVLQRMDDPDCKYSIALPDFQEFRRLWNRLSRLSKKRTGITALFVSGLGAVTEAN